MNHAHSAPQINILAQLSNQMQPTSRINPAQVPQVNATDQMNVQMRINQAQRINQVNQRPISIQQYLAVMAANQNIQNIRFSQPIAYTNAMPAMAAQQIANSGFIRPPT